MRDYKNLVLSEGVKQLDTLHVRYVQDSLDSRIPHPENSEHIEERIRSNFAFELANIILKNNYMIITKEFYPARLQNEYNGRLTVAPANMRGIISEDYHYEVQGIRFDTDEIEEALKNTWPEKFL
jgi:hypothetical protein